MKLRWILFLALSSIALIPVLVLAAWVYDRALEQEIKSVTDTHLTIAKNLSAALDRYANDTRNGFELIAKSTVAGGDGDRFLEFMRTLDFNHLCIADVATGRVMKSVFPEALPCPETVPEKRMDLFREIAVEGKTVYSPVLPNPKKEPTIYLLRKFGDELAIGAFATTYIVEQGKSIAFGKLGHAAVVDHTGSLLAHPLPKWRETMKNIAKLSPVKKMLAKETGTIIFFSPALKADMVAGYTFVPTTGWGVMIPQPFSELREHAQQFQFWVIGIAVAGLGAALLLSWHLATFLTRPLALAIDASQRMSEGDLDARIDDQGRFQPLEIADLQQAFNKMATDIEAANKELSLAFEKAEEGARAKTNFLTTISHEIRTPMNGVIGIVEMLKDSNPTAQQLEMIEILDDSSRSLLGIVNNVLDMSKIEAGHLDLRQSMVPVRPLIEKLVSEMRMLVEEKSLKLDTTVDADVPDAFRCDEGRLHQILVNLLSNAIKFTEDGNVLLRVRRVDGGNGEDTIAFSIQDTGIGIQSEDMENLFSPFTQVDETTTGRVGGTGLGLSISQNLAHLLGGAITVDSTPGEGSTFRLALPVGAELEQGEAPAENQEAPAPEAARLPEGERPRILVAEDHPTNQWVIQRQLEQLGYEVEIYDDGAQALDAFRAGTTHYDLVLTDYLMPEMDGIELTQKIRGLEAAQGRRTPIVGLTANAFTDVLTRCSEAGMDEMVTKPVTSSALRSVLDRLIAESREAGGGSELRITEDDLESGEESLAHFDRATSAEMIEGDKQRGADWLEEFLGLMEQQIEEIKLCQHDRDPRQLSGNLHKLAGAAAAVGAAELNRISRAALNAVTSSYDHDDAQARIEAIEAEAVVARGEILDYVSELRRDAG